jgi:hypothetical protein
LRLEIHDRLNNREQVEGGAGKPVDAGDDDHVVGMEPAEQLVELAPVGAGAAHLLAKDALAAGDLEPFELLVRPASRSHPAAAVSRRGPGD